jgi:hypothetical protein
MVSEMCSSNERSGSERMRDEEYCEVMLEAYRDVLALILRVQPITTIGIVEYLEAQIKIHVEWDE